MGRGTRHKRFNVVNPTLLLFGRPIPPSVIARGEKSTTLVLGPITRDTKLGLRVFQASTTTTSMRQQHAAPGYPGTRVPGYPALENRRVPGPVL